LTTQAVNTAVESPWRCAGLTTPHEWRYLGRKSQSYRCGVCLGLITKGSLKKETDFGA